MLSQRQRSLRDCEALLKRKLETYDFVCYEKILREYEDIYADMSGFDWSVKESRSTIGTVISAGYLKTLKEL